MEKKILKIFFINILFLMALNSLYAAKAVSSIVYFTQPNGTIIPIRIYGDEFLSYKKNMAGYIVEQGPDGFLYYADYNTGELRLSGNRVTHIPQNIIRQIRERNIAKKRDNAMLSKSGLPLLPFNNITLQSLMIIKTPVLLVEFADVKFLDSNPYSKFNAQLNESGYSVNGATGSAADYFNDNMRGKYSFSFEVLGTVITLNKNQSYYGADAANMIDANIEQLFIEACKAASEKGLDFSNYDWFGDGLVRDVAIIYAGISQAETGNTNDIWPQYHVVKNMSYNGKTIRAFSCSAQTTSSGLMEKNVAGIGTFCHEFAHALGLPDMYDTNWENEGEGVALWKSLSIMDEGNYLNYGRTPPYFTAIEREILGDKAIIPTPGNNFTILPVGGGGEMCRIDSENTGEYFLIESRMPEKWDKYIGGEGMIVYHVDKSQSVYGGIPSYMRWEYNNINCFAQHQCATVFPSSSPAGPDLAHLFFPGISGVTELTSYGKSKFTDWSGKPLGINLSNISYKDGVTQFTAVPGQIYDQTLPYVQFYNVFPYQYDCRINWEIPPGMAITPGKWRLRWNSTGSGQNQEQEHELYISDNYCYISNIKPNSEYVLSIVFERENLYGKDFKITFKTKAITSPMPYIAAKGEYKVGDILDLRVLNLVEEYSDIKWYINSAELNSSNYELKIPGVSTIEIIIQYKDGTQEHIRKKIKVN